MDGIFPLGCPVNDNVKIVAAFAFHDDKLLILGSVPVDVVHKGHVALRGKGLRFGFHDYAAVVGFLRRGLRVGSNRKAAHKDKGGAKYGKACKDFILHLHCPPVPHSLRA